MVSLRSEHPRKVKSLLGLFYRYYYMNASGMLTSFARPQDVKYHSEYLIFNRDGTPRDASQDFSSRWERWKGTSHYCFITLSCLLMFLFLNPLLTDRIRRTRSVLFEVGACLRV